MPSSRSRDDTDNIRMESPFKSTKGLRHVWSALHYSLDGLRAAYRNEDAFRQEVWIALIAVPVALWLGDSALERALMIGSVLLVMVVELLNSAIEAVVDRVSLERHPLSKRAKDIGSAAVFMALLNAAVVWALLLLD